ncbi:MAG: hypothetical protein JXA99_13600 [Candidatus Lokiarchaeota archaeon]|nr:hypothetical protein [Candidatus Lokiarchaeota archaeon]
MINLNKIKLKRKKYFTLGALILISVFLFESSLSLGYTQRFLWQRYENNLYSMLYGGLARKEISKVQAQGDVVYDPSGTGSEFYGLYLYNKQESYEWIACHMERFIKVHIYISVLRRDQYRNYFTGYYSDTTSWRAPIQGLFAFTGDTDDMIFTDNSQYSWNWNIQTSATTEYFGMQLQLSDGDCVIGSGIPNANTYGESEGEYRYMGYCSFFKGFNLFQSVIIDASALIKLRLDNSLAKSYANGKYWDYYYGWERITYLQIKFKIVFEFCNVHPLSTAGPPQSYTHIIGDNSVPSTSGWSGTDNYIISFKPGNSPL